MFRRLFIMAGMWTIAGVACHAYAQQHSRVFVLDNVMLDPDISHPGSPPMPLVGEFRWTWTEGDFDNGTGQFLSLHVPWIDLYLPSLLTTIEPAQIEITMRGNFDQLGVDILLRLEQPFTPDGPVSIDRANSMFTIEPGIQIIGHAEGFITPCTAPTFVVEPDPVRVCTMQDAVFSVQAQGEGTIAYRWQMNDTGVWSDLTDGYLPGVGMLIGTDTPEMTVMDVEGQGEFRCTAVDDCTTSASASALLTVDPGLCCPADLTGDGVADSSDFFAYLDLFASGDPAADITGNGVIDADDFFAYLDLFIQGC